MTRARGQQGPGLPIGLFDSGVGGLTVLAALRERLPDENFVYLGDTARLPYGTKSKETIIRYALQAAAKLVEQGIKLLVIACNTASSAALPELRRAFAPLPVIGVVEPGAIAAAEASRSGHIAVIATEATIARGAYQEALRRLRPGVRVTAKACSLFVALAEEGWLEGAESESVAARYLRPLFNGPDGPDCLLLGCTHFPLLLAPIRTALGPEILVVDSARTTAESVVGELASIGFLRKGGRKGTTRFFTTDDIPRFARTGSLFLGAPIPPPAVTLIDL
jgi:glutamate racemase